MHLVVDLVPPPPEEPEDQGRWWWGWLWPYVRPVHTAVGGLLALLPMPWTGYSAATTWAYTVHKSRAFGIPVAYGLGLGALAMALGADHRAQREGTVRQLFTRTVTVIAFIGVTGAVDFFDPVTALTGVRP
ncbi:hypothetical protein CTZ27_33200 [Streptomyces griseocarneus]|nr:hypothetical protein CTZ27_33200 [Streptomyces griseocarneus]